MLEILDFDGEHLSIRDEHGRIIEIGCDRFGIKRGGHHDEFKIGSRDLLKSFGKREGNIALQVALVKLVEENCANAVQYGIVLQPAQENAFGHKCDASLFVDVIFEPDLITNFATQFRSAFTRNSGGNCPRGYSSRLQYDDP